jgi:hypothetical protein
LDNFRHTVDSVVARFGEQLHVRRVHSFAACDCAGGACLPVAIGQASGALERLDLYTSLTFDTVRAVEICDDSE